ncbi:tetraspanin-1-like [Colias croceus]|uniref:tetraspanin-1-like n=1 Tax=Colias crocea TaxID=72248 RepID=UPI001E27E1E4|nr:tetraspanin-1-like [Colias croceus]
MHTVGLPRTCLGFTNFLFFLLGLISLAICVWCMINTEFFTEVNYTVTKSSLVSAIANFVNLKLWFTPMTTILIPVACLAVLTSCCGVLGAGCRTKCAIKSYIFLVTALSFTSFWLFFVSGIYNIYTDNPKTRSYLRTAVTRYYGRDHDLITYVTNKIMVDYECCGVDNYQDFFSTLWQKNNMDKIYPMQCCKLTNKTSLVPVSKNCTQIIENIEAYIDKGCFNALRQSIKDNKAKIIFYVVLILFAYSVIMLFGYCIIRGEPLIGAIAGDFASYIPTGDNLDKVVVSNSSLDNMMFAEEPPKKVVRVVSAINPGLTYKLTPSFYGGNHGFTGDRRSFTK